ncbi:MAG: cyclic nucleotide-binding domain-containing protein [Agarilytica sp.]
MLAENLMDVSSHPLAFEQVREKISLFGGLSDKQLDLLLPYLKCSSYVKGDYIFKQGQLPSCVFILLKGVVSLQIRTEDDGARRIRYIAGDCFGETSVIGIQPQLGSAHIEEDAELMVLSRACLLDIVKYDQDMFGVLMMNIAREVSRRFHSCLLSAEDATEYSIPRAFV